ncbi:hypothetical protein OROGR_015538 [Orobanche gracilis]
MAGSKEGDKEVLIQWEGMTDSDNTWEDYQKMLQLFPEFHLEEKAKIWAGGIDKDPPFLVYSRKKKNTH